VGGVTAPHRWAASLRRTGGRRHCAAPVGGVTAPHRWAAGIGR
jgi:hypothetical protein